METLSQIAACLSNSVAASERTITVILPCKMKGNSITDWTRNGVTILLQITNGTKWKNSGRYLCYPCRNDRAEVSGIYKARVGRPVSGDSGYLSHHNAESYVPLVELASKTLECVLGRSC